MRQSYPRKEELKKARVNLTAIDATLKGIRFQFVRLFLVVNYALVIMLKNMSKSEEFELYCYTLWICCRRPGLYFIPVVENLKIASDDKSAVVRVLEGSFIANQLAVELDKLLPRNSWVIEEKGNDAFFTNFPSSEVLNHMVNWGPMDTDSERKDSVRERNQK